MRPVRSFLFPTYLYSWMSQPRVTSWTPINHSPLGYSELPDSTVIYMEGNALTTQVAYPRLGGKTKSHLLNFQKQLLIPELRQHFMVSAALADADDRHWKLTNDLIYPACLEGFRRRHESSQASQANKSAERSGTGGGSPTDVTTPPSATSSQPPPTPTLGAHEARGLVRDTLDQVYALRLETLQEMGFIREVAMISVLVPSFWNPIMLKHFPRSNEYQFNQLWQDHIRTSTMQQISKPFFFSTKWNCCLSQCYTNILHFLTANSFCLTLNQISECFFSMRFQLLKLSKLRLK